MQDSIIASFVFENINYIDSPLAVRNFFLKILQKVTNDLQLQAQFVALDKGFCLEVSANKEQILNLSEILQRQIPLSLQFAFKELLILESFATNNLIKINNEQSNFLTPQEIQDITSSDSAHFCDLWGDFIDFKQTSLTLLDSNKKHKLESKESLKSALEGIAKKLQENKSIFLKTTLGKFEARLFNEANVLKEIPSECIFMPFCLNSAKLLFKVENEELQALATLEKPILTLHPKSAFSEHFAPNTRVILPFMPYLTLLSKFLDSQGLYLLPIKEDEHYNDGICAFVETQKIPLEIGVSSSGVVVVRNFGMVDKNAIVNAFLECIKEQDLKRTNALYLGLQNTKFFVYFDEGLKEPLNFAFESNLHTFLETLSTKDKTTQSLLNNFSKEFGACVESIKKQQLESNISYNLLDLVGLAGVLLDLGNANNLKDSAKCVFNKALEFMGKKGPRIDFKLERDEKGEIYLDTQKTLRSVMSFRLAGVECELLCFGILDSLAEFFANFVRDMEENYQTKGVMLCGSFFFSKQFLDQFLHYLPKEADVFTTREMEFI